MVIDSTQTLLSAPVEEAPSGPGAEEALRRMLDENPKLLRGYFPWSRPSIDALVTKYAGEEAIEEASEQSLATILMVTCVVVKVLCFIYCKSVARMKGSGVVAALADDHFNDALTNFFATVTMVIIKVLEGKGVSGAILEKIDPAVALVLSIFIVYNWVTSALEQLKVLSDQRVEEADAEAVRKAAEETLKGSVLQLTDTHVYGVGEGCSVSLELAPVRGSAQSQTVARTLGELDQAIRKANEGVQEVQWRLRKEQSFDWVKEYAKP